MLRSKFCHLDSMDGKEDSREDHLDPGGYFVVNGVEKTILSQLKLRGNIPFVFASKGTVAAKYSHVAEVRSVHAKKWRSTSTIQILGSVDKVSRACKVVVLLPFVSRGSSPLEVPLICAIRAFESIHNVGPYSVDELMSMFFLQGAAPDWADLDIRDMVRDALLAEPFASMTAAENIQWLELNGAGKERTQAKRHKYIQHILTNEVGNR